MNYIYTTKIACKNVTNSLNWIIFKWIETWESYLWNDGTTIKIDDNNGKLHQNWMNIYEFIFMFYKL